MKQRKVIFALSLFLFLNATALAIPFNAKPSPARDASGRVSGVVFDVNDARVTKAKVTIKARNFSREVLTAEAGQFDIDLPAGEYYFTVEANGFCRFEGESLKIKPGATEMINIHLEVLVSDSPDACKCTSRRRRK
jgi:hypothetical protein